MFNNPLTFRSFFTNLHDQIEKDKMKASIDPNIYENNHIDMTPYIGAPIRVITAYDYSLLIKIAKGLNFKISTLVNYLNLGEKAYLRFTDSHLEVVQLVNVPRFLNSSDFLNEILKSYFLRNYLYDIILKRGSERLQIDNLYFKEQDRKRYLRHFDGLKPEGLKTANFDPPVESNVKQETKRRHAIVKESMDNSYIERMRDIQTDINQPWSKLDEAIKNSHFRVVDNIKVLIINNRKEPNLKKIPNKEIILVKDSKKKSQTRIINT